MTGGESCCIKVQCTNDFQTGPYATRNLTDTIAAGAWSAVPQMPAVTLIPWHP
jgi:hypothetical protein